MLTGAARPVGAVLISLVLNVGVFWLGFRLATARMVPLARPAGRRGHRGRLWQILQLVGGYVVSHQLHRASELYGTFGVVLGLLAWLFLQAEVTLYAAEVDVVLARRLWPVSVLAANPIPNRLPKPQSRPSPPTPGRPARRRRFRRAGRTRRARPRGPQATMSQQAVAAPASDGKPARDGKAGKAA